MLHGAPLVCTLTSRDGQIKGSGAVPRSEEDLQQPDCRASKTLHREWHSATGQLRAHCRELSGTGDSQCDSRDSICANRFAIQSPIFIARQADSRESPEFPIRTNRAHRFARITPVRGRRSSFLVVSREDMRGVELPHPSPSYRFCQMGLADLSS